MNPGGRSVAGLIDALNIAIGRTTAWLTLVMVVVTFVIVVLRYVFGIGFIWLQESVVWMHAMVFMLGAAYTLQQEEHVRIDIFYRDMSESRRAWVNVFGVLFFIFPICGFFMLTAMDYVTTSWEIHEVSRDSGGLAYPAIPMLKSVLIVMPALLALQGLSLLLCSLRKIRGR